MGVPVKTPMALRLKKAPSRAPVFVGGEMRTMMDGMTLMYVPEQIPTRRVRYWLRASYVFPVSKSYRKGRRT